MKSYDQDKTFLNLNIHIRKWSKFTLEARAITNDHYELTDA